MKNDNNFKIAKTNEEQQLVFGWANVAIRKDGTQIADYQDDMVEPEDLEQAAYEYVLKFRDTGERHDPDKRLKGKLVESVVFTKEKQLAMGLEENTLPQGWWVGFKINDNSAWEKIKKGDYQMFSVEGTGQRIPVDEEMKKSDNRIAKTFSEIIEKYNPYHDRAGKFSNRNGYVSFSPGKDDNQAKRSIANENKRRQADGDDEIGGAHANMGRKTRAELLAERNKVIDEENAAADKKIKDAQKPKYSTPENAGEKIDWRSMSDDEFVNNIDKYMPDAAEIGKSNIAKYGNAPDGSNNMNTNGWHNTKSGGDQALMDIYEKRGYNAKPELKTQAEMIAYLKANPSAQAFFRGHSTSYSKNKPGSVKAQEFISDAKHYAGLGVYGNGSYIANAGTTGRAKGVTTNKGFQVARSYASGAQNSILRIAFAADAKIGKHSALTQEAFDFKNKVKAANKAGKIDRPTANGLNQIAKDIGRYAALRGYDGFLIDNGMSSGGRAAGDYAVALNRGKLIVQKEVY
jgi:hypothetical protein